MRSVRSVKEVPIISESEVPTCSDGAKATESITSGRNLLIKVLVAALFVTYVTAFNYGGCIDINGSGKSSGSSGTSTPTLPAQVTSPTPADNATNVITTTQLSWASVSGDTSYDVYFGTTPPGTFIGNQAGTTYNPGTLTRTVYYWRIDPKNSVGTTTGVVWNFTTFVPWTRQLGTSTDDYARDVATDASGNIYVTGWTSGGLDGNTNAGVGGTTDLFVVKYDPAGVKQWARQLGTSSDDNAQGVATDSSGNIYVAGNTLSGLDGNTDAGGTDLCVVKYNSSGVKQWTRQLGTSNYDSALDVAADSSSNIYVVGENAEGLDGNTSAGGKDLFIVKYDSAGVKQWTRQLGSSSWDHAHDVTVDASGNIYIAGWTEGGLDGNTNAGGWDLVLVKYDSAGVKQWTRQLGTASNDYANGAITDASGNIYVAGQTEGGLDGNTNAGSADLFVVKYDSAGVKQWTRQLGTSSNEGINGVAIDASGNIYIAGKTGGGLDGNTNAGGTDLFVVKYNSAGVKQWTSQSGSSINDNAQGVAIDLSGNIYITGFTNGGLDGNTNAGSNDLFVVKYNSAGEKQ